ncbi:Hypothetical predicted protein [Scomber scombrus]|uniref:Uncharacterized protein n=1 Tax=Scomber scombrus TaxID=13677 RepID=A0AAV1NBR2_SCOSC
MDEHDGCGSSILHAVCLNRSLWLCQFLALPLKRLVVVTRRGLGEGEEEEQEEEQEQEQEQEQEEVQPRLVSRIFWEHGERTPGSAEEASLSPVRRGRPVKTEWEGSSFAVRQEGHPSPCGGVSNAASPPAGVRHRCTRLYWQQTRE